MAEGTLFLPPQRSGYHLQINGFSGVTRSWVTWEKPRGFTWFSFLCVGGAAGGTSGFPSATTTARGGGGGGGGGGLTVLMIPALALPEVLHMSPGLGGAGGASSTTVSNPGAVGQDTRIAIAPIIGAIYTFCSANGGNAGNAATAAAAGTAGAAGSVVARSAILPNAFGIIETLASPGGGIGGAINGAGGNSTYPVTGILFSGGGGGGGGTSAGGNAAAPASQASPVFLPARIGGTAGAPGNPGQGGLITSDPLLCVPMSIGGAGGGASSDGVAAGGAGGDGGPGSGGGGGGAGGTTGGGGAGGRGGAGWIDIWGW